MAGDPFAGKTTCAATFPKPMIYMDFDDNFESVISAKDKSGKLVVSEMDRKEITVIKFQKEKAYSIGLNTVQKGSIPPSHAIEAPLIIDKMNKVFDDLMAGRGVNGDGKVYRSLVIDSGTKMFMIWKEALMQNMKQSALQIQDYGTLEACLFGQLIPTLKALPIDYKILITHIGMDKDDKLGMIYEYPIATSKKQGRLVAREFTEFWKLEVMGDKRVVRTTKQGMLQFGSRSGVPDMTEACFNELGKYLELVVKVASAM